MANSQHIGSADLGAEILTIAVEGRINRWASVSVVQQDENEWNAGLYRIVNVIPFGSPREACTVDGTALYMAALDTYEKYPHRKAIEAMLSEDDASHIDVDDADLIVQVLLFGESVYS